MKIDIFGAIALLVSAISLAFSILTWRRGKNINTYAASSQIMAQLERSLADVPTALRFHGVTPEQLKEIGVTPEEFAYLVAHFSAGRVYHYGVNPNDIKPFEPGGYRYTLLKSPATRKAWPVLRQMVSAGKYRDKIEVTIKAIEAEEAAQIDGTGFVFREGIPTSINHEGAAGRDYR